jgi:hypothetical protein
VPIFLVIFFSESEDRSVRLYELAKLRSKTAHMSAVGQKRRVLQQRAAPRLPLYADSDQTRAALRYVATGRKATSQTWCHITEVAE